MTATLHPQSDRVGEQARRAGSPHAPATRTHRTAPRWACGAECAAGRAQGQGRDPALGSVLGPWESPVVPFGE